MASSRRVRSRSAAKAVSRSTMSKERSSNTFFARSSGSCDRRVPSGGGVPRWNLPVSIPLASGKYGRMPRPWRSAERDRVVLLAAVEQAQLVLQRDEGGRALRRRRLGRGVDPRAVEVGAADLAHLARVDQRLQRAERLLDRHVVVGPVHLVEVDAVRAEPARATPRTPGRTDVGMGAVHRPELGGHDHVVPRRPERPTEELLALAAAVDVGRVEERDALVQRGLHHLGGAVRVDPHPEVVAAEPDERDLERPDGAVSMPRSMPRPGPKCAPVRGCSARASSTSGSRRAARAHWPARGTGHERERAGRVLTVERRDAGEAARARRPGC